MANDQSNGFTQNKKIRIKKFSCSEPVHAFCAKHDFSFVDLLGFTVGGWQSHSMTDIDLRVDLSFASRSIPLDGDFFEISLRRSRLILENENASVIPGTSYTMVLQEGKIKSADKGRTETSSNLSRGGAASGKLEAGLVSWLPKFGLSGSATVDASGSKTQSERLEASDELVPSINLVVPGGQNRWVIGGERGDPRRPTGDLAGNVIESGDEAVARPLCRMRANDPESLVEGRLSVSIDNGLDLVVIGAKDRRLLESMYASLQEDGVAFFQRQIEAELALKSRMAALAALKPESSSRQSPSATGVVLASISFCFEPELQAE